MWKQILNEWLRYTRKERTGIITLVTLIIIAFLLPNVFQYLYHPVMPDFTEFKNEIARLQFETIDSIDQQQFSDHTQKSFRHNYDESSAPELFYFDPNAIDDAGWKKLGLKEKTINTIRHFKQKGGRFKHPEDIRKIWGLSPEIADALQEYVRIPADSKTEFEKSPKPVWERKQTSPVQIDINQADTTQWIALPGIGSKLAARIVAFREKLGGFYRVEQVAETFGLQDSVFRRLKPRLELHAIQLKQISINKATLEELKQHPYLKFAGATAIVRYREQHGPFQQVADCRKIIGIGEEQYQKVAPYLKVD